MTRDGSWLLPSSLVLSDSVDLLSNSVSGFVLSLLWSRPFWIEGEKHLSLSEAFESFFAEAGFEGGGFSLSDVLESVFAEGRLGA